MIRRFNVCIRSVGVGRETEHRREPSRSEGKPSEPGPCSARCLARADPCVDSACCHFHDVIKGRAALFIAWALLDERMPPLAWGGVILAAIGVALASRANPKDVRVLSD